MTKNEAKNALRDLLDQYERQRSEYSKSGSSYNETQLRNDFLNPFLELLGWDVENKSGSPQHLREVVHEANVDVTEEEELTTKNPDYALRVGGKRRLFVEAKKPSVNIQTSKGPAFQVRRYGWNAGLTISVLSNFDKLALYDCRYVPDADDPSHTARLQIYDHTEYIDRFDEIYDLLSRSAIYDGSIEEHFPDDETIAEAVPFDSYFLNQIETWRELLASDLLAQNTDLSEGELSFLIQRLLNRIIFLRVCEDRDLETYEQLKEVSTYNGLKELFLEADKRYNSGLFDFIEDRLSLGISVSADVLISIFRELYFPHSPYNFAVVEAGILGEIYELFLGRDIVLEDRDNFAVIQKPEVVASDGVVPTPKYIVDEIVDRTLSPLFENVSPTEVSQLKICDISCGSGVFLLSAYEYLVNFHREWYLADGPEKHTDKLYEGDGQTWHLTLGEKRRILLNNIYGVDIDSQAVEVAKFSLLLKVLEDESSSAIDAQLERGSRALPNLKNNLKCGNSLVDRNFFDACEEALTDDDLLAQVNPFDWEDEFPEVMTEGGFDAIIGNPPYIRIQNMVRYSEIEVDYYRSDQSGFKTAGRDNFDKYYLFVERSLELLQPDGYVGYILPHKFFTLKGGKRLRGLIAEGNHLQEIVHFGTEQVFPGRSTYTAILVLSQAGTDTFTVERVEDLATWRPLQEGQRVRYEAEEISDNPWVFVSPEVRAVFQKVRASRHQRLDEVAKIFVGLQTSADNIYILTPDEIIEEADVVRFRKNDTEWEIEADILKPCLKDATLEPYSQVEANALIIFPYRTNGGRAELLSEEEMRDNYPLCWNYLRAHKEALEDRSISGGKNPKWYQYGRSQSLTKFNGEEKLVWSVLALNPPYAFDDRNVMFTGGGNGPYYALRPKSDSAEGYIYFLLAVLSHPVIETMVKVRASTFRGGYYSHGKQFIRALPIRDLDLPKQDKKTDYEHLVDLSKRLATLKTELASETVPTKRAVKERKVAALSRQIEEEVSDLYNLEAEDLNVVREGDLYFATNQEDE